jgi:FlaA1/EpsC-like NDP-sugar epimerase
MDMGQPIKIADLAREMIHLSGHTEAEIPVVFSGLRPGEKLYEELLADADQTLPTPHPRLRLARLNGELPAGWIDDMLALARQEDLPAPAQLRQKLHALVPEYAPRQ